MSKLYQLNTKLLIAMTGSEVQAFIKSNTQELGKDKWLCPLSGKKFRAPEFVVKHIQNKHADKLENVKHEVRVRNWFVYCESIQYNSLVYCEMHPSNTIV